MNYKLKKAICLAYKDFIQTDGSALSADLWLTILGYGHDPDLIWGDFEQGATASGLIHSISN